MFTERERKTMGLSASQARLLSITSRLSDNELRSQTITTAKMALATKTSEASAAYLDALNQTQLMFSTYDKDGNKTIQKLTGTSLTHYGPLKNQYGIINQDGQIMVSETDATNYLESATMGEFLEKYGVANVEDQDKDNPAYIDKATSIWGSDWKNWVTGGTGTPGGLIAKEPQQKDYNKIEYTETTNGELYELFVKGQGSCGSSAQGGDWGCYLHVLAHLLDQLVSTGENPYDASKYPYTVTTTTGDVVEINYDYITGAGIEKTAALIPVSSAIIDTSDPEKTYYASGTMGADLKPDATLKEKLLSDYYYDANGVKQKKLLKDKIADMFYVLRDVDTRCSPGYGKNTLGTTREELLALYASFQEDMKLKEKVSKVVPDVEAWEKAHKEWEDQVNKEIEEFNKIDPIITEQVIVYTDKDQGQWYVNLWHRMNGPSDDKVKLDGIENGKHPDHDNGKDEPLDDDAKTPETGLTANGKVLWTVLEDGLMNSSEWLKYALENGYVTLERVNYTEPTEDGSGLENATWTSIIYTNAADITEQENEAAITRAEVEYQQTVRDIESKDKQYDNILKRLDTEHNALQTEYDSIKGVIGKNIERTLKMYSA